MENPLISPFATTKKYEEIEITSVLKFKEFPVEESRQKDGIRTTSGQLIWESPNPRLIKFLHEADPRIEYFPSEVPSNLKDKYPFSDKFAWDELSNSECIFGPFVGNRLSNRIKEEFKEYLPVAVRGVACSINGGVFSHDVLIRDIRDILQLGESQGRDGAMFTGVSAESEGFSERTNQYLAAGAEWLRYELAGDQKSTDKLFPALLVYDKSHLVKGVGYYAKLPKDNDLRSKIILKAYILDCPLIVKKP